MPESSTPESYQTRLQRIMDNVALRETDRVPYACMSSFFARKLVGATCRQMMYDVDTTIRATRDLIRLLDPDLLCVLMFPFGQTMEDIGYRAMKWPGSGVADDATFQYLDAEYMSADEYDEYQIDPTGFVFRKGLPRIAQAFEGLSRIPDFASILEFNLFFSLSAFADPQLQESLKTLMRTGELMASNMQKVGAFFGEMAEEGYPHMLGGFCKNPFDQVFDQMRGSKGGMLDLHRRPDKLEACVEKMRNLITHNIEASCAANHSNFVFLPMHWGLDGFMSPEQFKRFYWPPLRQVLMWIIDRGFTPCVLWEGKCDSRLEIIADLPAGKAIYWFEGTDLFRAKDILKDTVCIRGNVPASMLIAGTPDEVDEYCRKLITRVGRNGGFILDGAMGIPDEARIENAVAMARSVKKYAN